MLGVPDRVNAALPSAAHARSKLLRVCLVVEPALRATVLIHADLTKLKTPLS